jgi:hypothetical protein
MYAPTLPPAIGIAGEFQAATLVSELADWVLEELEKIEKELNQVESVTLTTLNVAPDKPRDGMVIFADGTDFNPGSGVGYYGWYVGAWHFLG